MATSLRDQIIHELDRLTLDQQQKLLQIVQQFRSSSLPPGTPGKLLIQLASEINFPHDDLMEIMQAIEEDTEKSL